MQEAPPEGPSNLEKLLHPHGVISRAAEDGIRSRNDQVAALQKRVEDLDNKLYEERFLWILVLIVVLDCFFLLQANNWSAPLVIGVLQLIGLVVLASKCRVDPIMPLIDKLSGFLPRSSPKSGD